MDVNKKLCHVGSLIKFKESDKYKVFASLLARRATTNVNEAVKLFWTVTGCGSEFVYIDLSEHYNITPCNGGFYYKRVDQVKPFLSSM